MERLRPRASGEWLRSSLYESSPVDCPPASPRFINAVVAFVPLSSDTPEGLLDWMLELEKKQGRLPKKVLNDARPLDMDLIAFGDVTISTQKLVLPHPRAARRRFVLEPMAEILPNFVFPGSVTCVSEMLRDLPADGTVMRLADS